MVDRAGARRRRLLRVLFAQTERAMGALVGAWRRLSWSKLPNLLPDGPVVRARTGHICSQILERIYRMAPIATPRLIHRWPTANTIATGSVARSARAISAPQLVWSGPTCEARIALIGNVLGSFKKMIG